MSEIILSFLKLRRLIYLILLILENISEYELQFIISKLDISREVKELQS